MTQPVSAPDPAMTRGAAGGEAPQLVFSVRMWLGGDPLEPEAAYLVALLRRIADRASPGTPLVTGPASAANGVASAGEALPAMPAGEDTVLICTEARTVHRGTREIGLTRREFDLLRRLAEHPGRVFGREQLLAGVCGHSWAGPRSIDVHVRRVRVKIGLDLPVISTIRGVGYRLTFGAPVRVVPTGEPSSDAASR
jgi:DNA-binding response OmpR family regulator